MRGTIKKIMTLVMIMVMTVLTIQGVSLKMIYAADNTLKICMGDSTTARHHKAVALGNKTEEMYFVLKEGTAKSSNYSSSNPSSFKIINTSEGRCVVEALAEGSGLVTLTVKTTTGETYTEKLFVSVYTRVANYSGVTNKNTDAYMGASTNSGVENYDDKGDIAKNTNLTITATCGNFYIFRTLDGTTFQDGKDTGFIKKSDINILATSLKINEDNTSISINGKTNFTTTITPNITTNKSVEWSSSNSNIAVTTSNGQITGKSEGTVLITGTTKDGTQKKDSVYVSVYTNLEECNGYLNTECQLYKIASDNFIKKIGAKGSPLTIVGKCDDYYRVCLEQDNQEISNEKYIYVHKKNVTIPITDINIPDELSMFETQKKEIEAEIIPSIATNQAVLWTSSNTNIAEIDENGKVTAKHQGSAVITVTSKENSDIYAKCRIIVKPYIAVTGIKIIPDKTEMEKGISGNIKVEVFPSNASIKDYDWNVNRDSIINLNSDGRYTAKTIGKVIVSVTTKDGGFTDSCEINVLPIKVKGVVLQKKLELDIHETQKLAWKITPIDATNREVMWSSANSSIAKVDKYGYVTGVSIGSTTIRITTIDGGFISECKITVNKYVKDIELNKRYLKTKIGEKTNLKLNVTPFDCTKKKIIWRSKNNKISSVNQDGTVIAKKPGETELIVYDQYTGAYDFCLVYVKAGFKKPAITLSNKNKKYTLHWKKQKYVTKYVIYEKAPKEKHFKKIQKLGSDHKKYVLKSTKAGTQYKIRLYCSANNQFSKYSNVIKIK